MLEMAINNVEMGSELDRVHILTFCDHVTQKVTMCTLSFSLPTSTLLIAISSILNLD